MSSPSPTPFPSTRALMDHVPQVGCVDTIQVRRSLHGPVEPIEETTAIAGLGLDGDHRTVGREPSPTAKRQITLIQAEHLAVVAGLLGADTVDPAATRRNIVVSGINLAALRLGRFTIGEVELEGTGHCHPCSIMETTLGAGGFQAMRGHGGITARIVTGGRVRVGDVVRAISPSPPDE